MNFLDRHREAQQSFESAAALMAAEDPRRRFSSDHARAAERKSNYYQSEQVSELPNIFFKEGRGKHCEPLLLNIAAHSITRYLYGIFQRSQPQGAKDEALPDH